MIRINVITNNAIWHHFIKNPANYIDRKTKKLNLRNKKFRTKIFICTLLLSGNKKIRELNAKFRKKNKSTDVLSFPFNNKKQLKKIIRKEREIYLGDIIINLNKIKNHKDKKLFEEKFDKLWIHGLVHLLGHDHKKEREFKKMHKMEIEYFRYVN